jgi:hypothetical protein
VLPRRVPANRRAVAVAGAVVVASVISAGARGDGADADEPPVVQDVVMKLSEGVVTCSCSTYSRNKILCRHIIAAVQHVIKNTQTSAVRVGDGVVTVPKRGADLGHAWAVVVRRTPWWGAGRSLPRVGAADGAHGAV